MVGAGAGVGGVAGGGVGGVAGGGAWVEDLGERGVGLTLGEVVRPRVEEGCPRAAAREACWAFAMENKGGLFIAGRRWEKRPEVVREKGGRGGEGKGANKEEEKGEARGVTEGSSTATRSCRWQQKSTQSTEKAVMRRK